MKYSPCDFSLNVIHVVVLNEYVEMVLEVLEREEVLRHDALFSGYNVSDEIIRSTALIIEYCDNAVSNYCSINGNKLSMANHKLRESSNITERIFQWFGFVEPTTYLDVDQLAYDWLEQSLTKKFVESGIPKDILPRLVSSYVEDTRKFRQGTFRYHRC